MIGVLAQGLLRGHISGVPVTKPVAVSLTSSTTRARPKSVNLTRSLGGFEQDVARLDVAMDEPLVVGRSQSLGGLHADPHDFAERQLFLPREPLLQRFAGDQLHDHVGQLASPTFRPDDSDHVFVGDRGGGPCFAAKTLPRDLVVRQFRIQNFDRDVPLQGESKASSTTPIPPRPDTRITSK